MNLPNFQFLKLPRADLVIAPVVLSFVLPPFPDFPHEANQVYKPIQNLGMISLVLKKGSNATNHPDICGNPT